MLETNTAEQNIAAPVEDMEYSAIGPDGRVVRCNVPWVVMQVKALPDYQLFVEFIDGTSGVVKMREQIFSDNGGVFKTLKDPAAFAAVSCTEGHVEWANGLDIAPDATHEDFLKYGEQSLR
jgi:hypothetical protein